MRVLLVEDDIRVAGALETAMRRRGYDLMRVSTAAAALAAPPADLVLLDLGLPDRDGIEVCQELSRRSSMAIIVITGRGQERERCQGLRAGADDYLVKPFGMAELQARIDAVMRRAVRSAARHGTVRVGPLTVDLDGHVATMHGTEIALTPKEYDLLAALARRAGAVVTRDELMTEVWLTTWIGNPHTIDVHVRSLRTKLGDPTLVQTVRGVGYRLRGAPAAPPGVT